MRAATETRDGMGGQERPTGASSVIFKFFLLSSSFFSFPDASFSAEYDNKRGRMGRERRGWDYISFTPSSEGWEGNGYVPCYSLFSTLFVSFSHSSSFPLFTVQQQAGLDGTQRDRRGRQ